MGGDDSVPEWWDGKNKKKAKERKSVLERIGLAKGASPTAKKDDPSWWHDGDHEPPAGEGSVENIRAPAPQAKSVSNSSEVEDGGGNCDTKDEHAPSVKEEPKVTPPSQSSEAAATFIEDSVDDAAAVKPPPASTRDIDDEGPKSDEDNRWEQKGTDGGDEGMPEWWGGQKNSSKKGGDKNVPEWWNDGKNKDRKQRKSVFEKMHSSKGISATTKKDNPSWWHPGPEKANAQKYVEAQDMTFDTDAPAPQGSSSSEQRDASGEENNDVDSGRMGISEDGSAEKEKRRKSIQGSFYLSDNEHVKEEPKVTPPSQSSEAAATFIEDSVDDAAAVKPPPASTRDIDDEGPKSDEDNRWEQKGTDGGDEGMPEWWGGQKNSSKKGGDENGPEWWNDGKNKDRKQRKSVFEKMRSSKGISATTKKDNPSWWHPGPEKANAQKYVEAQDMTFDTDAPAPQGSSSSEQRDASGEENNDVDSGRMGISEDGSAEKEKRRKSIQGSFYLSDNEHVKEEPKVTPPSQSSEAAATFIEDSVDDAAAVKPPPASTRDIDDEGPKSDEDNRWEQKGTDGGDEGMPEWWGGQKNSSKKGGDENGPEWWNDGKNKDRKQRKSVFEKMRSSKGISATAKKDNPSWWHPGPENANAQEYVKAQDMTFVTDAPAPQASSSSEQRDASGKENNNVDSGRMDISEDGSAEKESGSAEKEKRRKSIQGSYYLSDNEQDAAVRNSPKLLDSPHADQNAVVGHQDDSAPAWWHENESKDNSAPTWWHETNKKKAERLSVFERKRVSRNSQKDGPVWWDSTSGKTSA